MAGLNPKDYKLPDLPKGGSGSSGGLDPRSFITGQNLNGTPGRQAPNGWNTPFMQRFQTQYNNAVNAGTASSYFNERKDGIALWDDQSGRNEFKFGDVFDGGKRVGNIYDQYGQAAADQFMKPLLMSSTEQLHGQTVAQKRETLNSDVRNATTRKAYDDSVAQKSAEMGDWSQEAAAMGALGTGLIGAGIGSFLGPVGTAVGFGLGAAIGGTAAWMNRDELKDMAARGEAQADLAGRGGNAFAAGAARLQSWSQLAGKSMSPLSNFVHGSWDETVGAAGDNKVEFYATDASGTATRPGWLTAVDVASSLGDSALQFGSPVGRLGFQGYMGGTVAGKVGTMAGTGGATFDDRTGTYDNVFTDTKGNFDPLSTLGGVGDIGMDVVQMVSGGAMGKVSQALTRGEASRLSTWGAKAAAGDTSLLSTLGAKAAAGAEARAAKAAQSSTEELAGFKFFKDADGNVTRARASIQMFAPSEAVQALHARGAAMLAHGSKSGKVTAQEVYSAAKRIAEGSSTWKSAVVNGFGEGTEEAVQSVAEAVSHQQAPDFGEIATSWVYGIASGAGMSVGARMFGKSVRERTFDQARSIYALRNNGAELDRDQWDGMSEEQKRALTAMDTQTLDALKKVAKVQSDKMKLSATKSVADLNRVTDAVRQQAALERESVNDALDGNYLLTQAGYDIDDHMMVGSIETVRDMLADAQSGLQEQERTESDPALKDKIANTAKALAPIRRLTETAADLFYAEGVDHAAQSEIVNVLNQLMQVGYEINPSPMHWSRLADRVAALHAQLSDVPPEQQAAVQGWLAGVEDWMSRRVNAGPKTPQDAFTARALTLLVHRDPADNSGSFPALLPQVGLPQSQQRVNAALQVTHNVLQPLNGDFDGDRINRRSRIVMDDDLFMRVRTGQYLLGAMKDTRVNVLKRDFVDQNIELAYESLSSHNDAVRQSAQGLIKDVDDYVRIVVPFAVDKADALRKGLEAGNVDAFHDFLSALASDYTAEMQQFAAAEARNLYFELNSFFARRLQEFQTAIAVAAVPDTEALMQPSTNVAPVPVSAEVGEVYGRAAVNWTQRLFNLLPGADMFRKWQQLHYTKRTSTELNTPGEQNRTLQEMSAFYELLASGASDSALEALDAKDEISAKVLRMLTGYVRSRTAEGWGGGTAGLAGLANMRVPNVLADGTLSREPVSLVQWLIRKEVDALEAKNSSVLSTKPELAAKYARLRSMEPGRAFVEVFGGMTLQSLLGRDAEALGANRTVDELFSIYTNQDEVGRKADADAMKADARYHRTRDLPVLPSDFDATGKKGVTSYSLVVDAILEAGNQEISWNANHTEAKGIKGRVEGAIGDSSRRAQTAFRTAIQELQEWAAGLAGFKNTREEWQRLFEQNPDIGRAYLETFTNDDVFAMYAMENGELFVQDWVYDLLTAPPELAEMMYFRNTLLAGWRTLAVSTDPESDNPAGRTPENMNDRLHLLMWRLAAQEQANPFSQAYTQFEYQLLNSTNVDSFMSWLNNSELRQNEAPYTAWNRDVAELDPTRTKGGWSQNLQGSIRRQAVTKFASTVRTFTKEQARAAADDAADAVLEVRMNEALKNPSDENRHLVLQLQRSLDFARKFKTPLGPGARNLLLAVANWGMMTPGHDKAKAPAGFEALGAYLSRVHSMQFSAREQALLASLTSFSVGDAGRQAHMLLQDGFSIMDSQGRPVTMDEMTPAKFMELYAKPENRPLLNAMVHPAVLELNGDDRVDLRYVTRLRLSDLVLGNTTEDVLFGQSAKSKAVAASYIDSVAGGEKLTRYLNSVMVAQTTAATSFTKGVGAEMAKAANLTEEVVDVLRMLAPYAGMRVPHQNPDGTVTEMSALESLKLSFAEARKARQLKQRFGIHGPEADLVQTWVFSQLQAAREQILGEVSDSSTIEELRDIERRLDMLSEVMVSDQMSAVLGTYARWETADEQMHLYRYVLENREIQEADPTNAALRALFAKDPVQDADQLPRLSPAQWESIAKTVVSYELRRQYFVNVPFSGADNLATIPGKDSSWEMKYWDPSFSFLVDDLLDLVPAAAELHTTFERNAPRHSLSEIAQKMAETFLDPKKYGKPNPAQQAQQMQSLGQMFASPSKEGIGRGGLGPQHETTEGMATRRTWKVPDDSLRSTVVLTADELANWADTNSMLVSHPGAAEPVLEPMRLLRGRFTNEITVTDLKRNQTFVLNAGIANPAVMMLSQQADPKYGSITPHRLNIALTKLLQREGLDPEDVSVEVKFFHPLDMPADPSFANNIYFEGVALDEGDSYGSLAAAHWFSPGGIDQDASKSALEAAKKSKKALKTLRSYTERDRAALEGNWETDFGGMLMAKAFSLMNADLGDGDRINPMFFNAVFKSLKMRHVVRYIDDQGVAQVLTAEQVIELQRTGSLPQGAELVKLSEEILRTMLGEQGAQGAARIYDAAPALDPTTSIGAYENRITAEHLARVPGLAEINDGVLARSDMFMAMDARQGFQRTLVYDGYMSPEVASKFETVRLERQELASRVGRERLKDAAPYKAAASRALQEAANALSEDAAADAQRQMLGFPSGAPDPIAHQLDRALLNSARQGISDQSVSMGHVYYASKTRQAVDPIGDKVGLESLKNKGKKPDGSWMVQDDLVVVQLDSFPMDQKAAEKHLQQVLSTLMDRGVTIILVGDEASSQSLKTFGSRYMRDGGQYRRLSGSQTIFVEQDVSTIPMSKRAMEERLVETRRRETFNQQLFFETNYGGLQENAGALLKGGANSFRLAAANDPVPVSAFAGLGFTMPRAKDMHEIRQMIADGLEDFVVQSRSSGPWKKAWDKLSKRAQAEAEDSLRRSLDKAANALTDDGVYARDTEFGTGDIIPLYNPSTKKLLLYRHGHKAPNSTELAELLRDKRATIYGPVPLSQATTRKGKVIRFNRSSQYGLRVDMAMRLNPLFDKTAFEFEGMKVTWVPDALNLNLPDPITGRSFFGYVGISDNDSKQSISGRMNTFQGLISTLGIDFSEDLAKAMYETDSPTVAQVQSVRLVLLEIRRRTSRRDLAEVNLLMNAPNLPALVTKELDGMGLHQIASGLRKDFGTMVTESTSAEAQLLRSVLVYLSSDDGEVDHVLSAGGMNDPKSLVPGRFSRDMPMLFLQSFDMQANAALRKLVVSKLDSQLSKNYDAAGKLVSGVKLMDDLSITILTEDGKSLSGYLRRSEMHTTGDNPAVREMAEDRKGKQVASAQITSMAALALDARTSTSKEELAKLSALLDQNKLGKIESGEDLLSLMSDISMEAAANQRIPYDGPLARKYRTDMRALAQGQRIELNTDDWTTEEKVEYSGLRTRLAERMHLTAADAVRVDYWVRMRLGRSAARQKVDGVDPSAISFDDVQQELVAMSQNFDAGQLPVAAGMIPVMTMDDLAVLYRAAERAGDFWLRGVLDDPSSTVSGWQDWVHVALSFGEQDDVAWDAAYLNDVDANLHTYRAAGIRFADLPPSFDPLRSEQLLDPNNQDLLLSVSQQRRDQLNDDVSIAAMATIEDIFGGVRDGLHWRNARNPVSSVARQKQRWWRRRKAGSIPEPDVKTQKAVLERGVHFVNEGTKQNAVFRISFNIRGSLTLLNPMLWLGAPVEAWIQESLERASNIITGDSMGQDARLRGKSSYDLQQYKLLYQALGSNTAFKAMVHAEYAMHSDLMSAGPLETATWRLAKFAGKWQDPYWGMRSDTVARRYVESAARFIRSATGTNITAEMVTRQLSANPNWLKNEHAAAHQAAINVLLNLKNVKATVASLAWRGFVEPLSENPKLLPNMFGNVFLKLPFMFAGYTMNKAVQILGLQAFDQAFALMLHGRKNPVFGRIQALMRGDKYNDEDTIDMSDVIETLDLTNAVVKSGLTHTGLMAMAMMAGSLGLSGEDEEDRRRRRAAMYQGAVHLYDPRDIENYFRNADAIYLDWLPFDLDEFFRVNGNTDEDDSPHSMANMNWIVKSILSPIIGIERFMNTGNPYEIVWAYKDAFYSMPLVNTMLFDDAVEVHAELAQAAADAAASDEGAAPASPDTLPSAFDFLLRGVLNYERMLLESSFINQLYVAADKYDRDAWALPRKTGETTDRLGNIQATQAMDTFVDPVTGETRQGYVGRDYWDATLHGYTENRGTLAILANVFTGFKGGYLRNEMVVKTRKIEKEALEFDEQKAILWGLYKGSVSLNSPSLEGIYIPYADRAPLKDSILARFKAEGLKKGLTDYKATRRAYKLWDKKNDQGVSLNDLLFAKQPYISYKQSDRYYQLNTTYVMGPDGHVWATGISRNFLVNFAGMAPLQRFHVGDVGNMGVDQRLNSTDDVRGINTGMRALEKVDESWAVPEEAAATTGYQPQQYTPYQWQNFGSGWRNFGRRGYGYGGGGGGGGGGGYGTKLYAPQDSVIPYGNDIPNVQATNPIFRRASIRRERVDSQRGRLKQWQ